MLNIVISIIYNKCLFKTKSPQYIHKIKIHARTQMLCIESIYIGPFNVFHSDDCENDVGICDSTTARYFMTY